MKHAILAIIAFAAPGLALPKPTPAAAFYGALPGIPPGVSDGAPPCNINSSQGKRDPAAAFYGILPIPGCKPADGETEEGVEKE